MVCSHALVIIQIFDITFFKVKMIQSMSDKKDNKINVYIEDAYQQ